MNRSTASAIQLDDGSFYAGDPFPALQQLRRDDPLYFREDLNTWFVTRYEDIAQISRNAMVFSSASGVLLQQLTRPPQAGSYFAVDTVATTDPPRHGELRRMVAPAFMPRRVAALESNVRDLCRKLVAELPSGEEIDFLQTVAAVVPIVVIASILGIDGYDPAEISSWSLEIVRQAQDLGPEEKRQSVENFRKLTSFVSDQIALKRRRPGEDLISNLLAVEPALRDEDVLAWAVLMMSAGHETTQSLMGNIVDVMDQFPDQLALVSAEPDRIPAMINETLRWRGVVTGFGRRALSDYRLRDQQIRAGQNVFMLYIAANRDPDVFTAPEQFDITQHRAHDNLAFGIGNHYCPGHAVARMETRILFEELFARYRGWQVTSRQRLASNLRIGNAWLKVRFDER